MKSHPCFVYLVACSVSAVFGRTTTCRLHDMPIERISVLNPSTGDGDDSSAASLATSSPNSSNNTSPMSGKHCYCAQYIYTTNELEVVVRSPSLVLLDVHVLSDDDLFMYNEIGTCKCVDFKCDLVVGATCDTRLICN
eukprot:scaffold3708_cov205-Alexandrium_tamarense.AAC.10